MSQSETASLSAGLRWVGIASGTAMLGIGTLATLNPEAAARSYGVPVNGEYDRAYLTAAGVRDLCLGGLLLTFSLLRDRRALGVSAALGSAIAVGDGVIALRHGPDPIRVLPVHWGGAVGAIGLAVLLLRRKS